MTAVTDVTDMMTAVEAADAIGAIGAMSAMDAVDAMSAMDETAAMSAMDEMDATAAMSALNGMEMAPTGRGDNGPRRRIAPRNGGEMGTGRLEAFSDGVLAVIITIMVLELHAPHGDDLSAILQFWPAFVSYVLSFIYVGIYWNNHHHLLHATTNVTGSMLWANLHLLFWLSLIPFTTAWMGENHFAPLPSAAYGIVLMMSALSWYILQTLILRSEGPDSLLRRAIGRDWKGRVSPVLYLAGIISSFCVTGLAQALYLLVALIWLVPDPRIEKALSEREH